MACGGGGGSCNAGGTAVGSMPAGPTYVCTTQPDYSNTYNCCSGETTYGGGDGTDRTIYCAPHSCAAPAPSCSPNGTVVGQTGMTYQDIVLQDDDRCCSGASVYGGQYGRDITCRGISVPETADPWVDVGCGAITDSYNPTCNPTQEPSDITCAEGQMLQARTVYGGTFGSHGCWSPNRLFRDQRRCVANAACPVTPPPQPNLTAGATSNSAYNPAGYVWLVANTPSTFSSTLSNIGNAIASNFPNVFWIENIALTGANNLTLGGGASGNISGAYTFTTPGSYNVRSCADMNTGWGSSISESNEGDNCGPWANYIVTPGAPTGLAASCNASAVATLSWTAPSGGSPAYYVRVSPTNGGACPSGWQVVDWGSGPLCIPNPDSVSGTSVQFGALMGQAYSWWVHGRATGGEWSPAAYGSFTCAGSPDLTASASTPSSATAGVSTTLSSTISNIGTGSAGTSFTSVWITNAANGGGSVVYNNDLSTPSIANGASSARTNAYTFSSAGTYSVRFCADNTTGWVGSITESNEANNCGSWTNVTVTAPTPPAISCNLSSNPSPLTGGASATFTWSSTNANTCTGNGFSTGGATSGTSASVAITPGGIYQLTCTSSSGASPCVQQVTASQPTASLTATPTRVNNGSATTLTWTSAQCTSVSVTGTNGFSSTQQNATNVSSGTITGQTTFTLDCDSGALKRTVIVNVVPKFEEF